MTEAMMARPFYPLATTRPEALAIAAWLVETEICADRGEALRTVLGADRDLVIAAYRSRTVRI